MRWLEPHIQEYKRFVPIIVIVVGIIAYSNSFPAGFFFDDFSAIVNNPQVYGKRPLALHSRVVTDFTFRLNYMMSGYNSADFRATNVAIHIIAGLLLYGVIRRTLLLPYFHERYKENADWIAGIISSLWVSHPIQTESVTYICQRYESLMGLFYLLTLYCFIRGVTKEGSSRRWWLVGSLASAFVGMGTKQVMVTVPIVVFLYDWMFIVGSPLNAFRLRKLFYIFMLATSVICVLLTIMVLADLRNKTGIILPNLPPIRYFATQMGVILHYIKLVVVPFPLCLDYGWEVAETAGEILPSAIILTGIGLLSIWGCKKGLPAGFLGCAFFIILAPTSSFMPVGDIAFEHRMYLSLAPALILLVFVTIWIVNRICFQILYKEAIQAWLRISLAVMAIVTYIGLTLYRNYQYLSPIRLWSDVVKQRPYNLRAHLNLCHCLREAGLYTEAERAVRQALLTISTIRAEPKREYEHTTRIPEHYEHKIYNTMGIIMQSLRKHEKAINAFQKALQICPSYDEARHNLAVAIAISGRNHEASQILADLVKQYPEDTRLILTMGIIMENDGKYADAIRYYRQVNEMATGSELLQSRSRLAWLLATVPDNKIHNPGEAVQLAEEICKATEYRSWRALDILASAYASLGRWEEAVQLSQRALEILKRTSDQQQFTKEVKTRLQSYISQKPWYISPINNSSSDETKD